MSKIYTEESLRALFNEMDINHDGTISEKELNALITGIDRGNLFEGVKGKGKGKGGKGKEGKEIDF